MRVTTKEMAKKDSAKAPTPVTRVAWKREASDQHLAGKLGQRIRERREKLGMSLAKASELSGIPAATLSRIETNKMTPTFPILLKLMTGLRLPWADLMGNDETPQGMELSIALPAAEEPTEAPGYSYQAPHHANPLSEHMQPLLLEVQAKTLEAAGGLRAHKGFEFCYVLAGAIIFHAEGKEPSKLPTGASILFRCDIPHAYVTSGSKPARLLIVTSMDPVMLENAGFPIATRKADAGGQARPSRRDKDAMRRRDCA